MKTHELYINDIRMDIDKDVNIYPRFQSPVFTDIKYITSHITNNISLPITPNNALAIEMYHLADKKDPLNASNTFPRRWHKVRYYRNGMEICRSALGKIISIEGGRINFAFSWGNIENFEKMFNKTLTQLSFNTTTSWSSYIGYASDLNSYDGLYNIDFGVGSIRQYQHPCVTSNFIISQIAKDNGITIRNTKGGKLLTDNYLIPCLTKKSNAGSDYSSRYWSTSNEVYQKEMSSMLKTLFITPKPYANENPADGPYDLNNFHDPACLWNEADRVFDVSDIDKIRFTMTGFTLESTYHALAGYPEPAIELCSGIKRDPIKKETVKLKKEYIFAPIDMEIDVSTVDKFTIKIGDIKKLTIPFTDPNGTPQIVQIWQNISLVTAAPNVTIVPVLKELRHGTKRNSEVQFPLAINLPEIKQSEFLHAVMQMNGLFAYAKDEKTIDFLSIDDIVDNIPRALDWTDKLVNASTNYTAPDGIEFEFLDFERRNKFVYDNDSDIKNDYGAAYLYIDNTTLKDGKDKEIVKLPFSASDSVKNRTFGEILAGESPAARVPLYTKEESSEGTVSYEYNDSLKPRILRPRKIGQYVTAAFEKLDWKTLLSEKYKAYRNIIRNPRVLKVECRLSDIDIARLNFSLPVRFSQFGGHYALITVQTTANGICKCELLEIKSFSRNSGPPGQP